MITWPRFLQRWPLLMADMFPRLYPFRNICVRKDRSPHGDHCSPLCTVAEGRSTEMNIISCWPTTWTICSICLSLPNTRHCRNMVVMCHTSTIPADDMHLSSLAPTAILSAFRPQLPADRRSFRRRWAAVAAAAVLSEHRRWSATRIWAAGRAVDARCGPASTSATAVATAAGMRSAGVRRSVAAAAVDAIRGSVRLWPANRRPRTLRCVGSPVSSKCDTVAWSAQWYPWRGRRKRRFARRWYRERAIEAATPSNFHWPTYHGRVFFIYKFNRSD